jgi:hypothetical protein
MKIINNILISTLFGCFLSVCSCKTNDSIVEQPPRVDTTQNAIHYIDTLPSTVPMVHSGGLHTTEDFARIKAKLAAGQEPWVSGWNKLLANSHAQLGYTPNPTVKLIRGGNSPEEPDPDNYSRAMNDAAAAYQTAIRWKISGDAAYAEKSIQILNAWAATCVKVTGDPNAALAAGIYGYEFAIVGELMRDYAGWKLADFKAYQKWMLDVFYSQNYSFLAYHQGCHPQHSWSNWDLCNMASAMAIGILADKRSIYNYVINYYQRGSGNGNNFNTVFYVFPGADSTMAEMQESGRDQGHCTLSLALLTNMCQLAWNQTDDLWGFRDNIILKASEYVAKYNVAMLNVPYKEYSWHEGDPWNGCGVKTTLLPEIGSSGRGSLRPMWTLIYNHYANVKKLTNTTYTVMGVQRTQPEGGGGDYGPNSGGFDSLGFGTLLFSR